MQSVVRSGLQPCSKRLAITADQNRCMPIALLLVTLLTMLAGLLSADPVAAQENPEHIRFDIPAGTLESALVAFSTVTGVSVSFTPDVVSGLESRRLAGRFTPSGALNQLLSNSGLRYRFTSEKAVTLQSNVVRQDQKVITLPAVIVSGKADQSGNLPVKYAGGQIASGGNLGILGNRDIMDTPFSQTNYTEALINSQQARTIADVLSNESSVEQQSANGTGQADYLIRGFDAGTAFNGLYGMIDVGSTGTAVETLERIEVLRGPAVLLYGLGPESSIGGTINLVPKRAEDEPLTRFTTSYYSDKQLGAHLDVGRRLGENNQFGIRFNGVYRDGDTAVDRQSEETKIAALALDYREKDLRLSADLGYQSRRLDGSRRYVGLGAGIDVPDAPDGSTQYSQPWAFREDENLYAVLRGEFDFSDKLTAFADAGIARYLSSSIFLNPLLTDRQGTLSLRQNSNFYTFSHDTSSIKAGLRGTFSTGFIDHAFAVSYSNVWQETGLDLASSLTAIPDTNLYNPVHVPKPDFGPSVFTGEALAKPEDTPKSRKLEHPSFAIVDTLSFMDERIQLTLGMRKQRIKTANFNRSTGAKTTSYDEAAWTPAAGLVVKPWHHVSLYASYIEGLQPGATAPNDSANAGEVFAPYETEQYEIGIKLDNRNWATTLALFEISQPNDFIDPVSKLFGLNGEVRSRGLEISAFGEPLDGVRILGGMTFLDAKLTKTEGGVNEGNDAGGFADFQAVLSGEWDLPFPNGLTVVGRMNYTSEKPVNDANSDDLPAWTRLDLGARYTIKSSSTPITLRANVENVLDEDYWATAGGRLERLSLARPRTFLLSATFDF